MRHESKQALSLKQTELELDIVLYGQSFPLKTIEEYNSNIVHSCRQLMVSSIHRFFLIDISTAGSKIKESLV